MDPLTGLSAAFYPMAVWFLAKLADLDLLRDRLREEA